MKKRRNFIQLSGVFLACVTCLWTKTPYKTIEASRLGATHIGTFEGNTTFTTSSENGINPGLFIEVMDEEGNLTQYESEEGVITIPNTKEGAYVTQAKLLGKTKYVDQDTGEVLDTWEEGRNLTLESVQSPVLTTVGENLLKDMEKGSFDEFGNEDNGLFGTTARTVEPIFVGDGGTFYAWMETDGKNTIGSNGVWYNALDINKKFVRSFNGYGEKYTLKKGEVYIQFRTHMQYWEYEEKHKMMISLDLIKEYKSYQSNILSVPQGLELRGIGDIKDELNLLTGELTQRIGKVSWGADIVRWSITTVGEHTQFFHLLDWGRPNYNTIGEEYGMPITLKPTNCIFENGNITDNPDGGVVGVWANTNFGVGRMGIKIPIIFNDEAEAKQWLNENPVILYYVLRESIDKTVGLSATQQFRLLDKSFIQVNGTIPPVITSITVPTDELSFALDPNQETGQQFIAPEFEVTNESNAPLTLTLKNFEQTTDVLNDVLSTKYESWDGLTKEQSKDIALGLVAKSSDAWLSHVDDPHYVSETNNNLLGTIKPKGTIGFEFIAHHGQAFDEILNPSYRLTFVFDLLR